MDYKIRKITKQYLLNNVDCFVNILKNNPFEYWTKENFILELSYKYQLSLAAYNEKQILGFIIASKKNNGVYIHKFMVDKDYRSKGIGESLQLELEKNALQLGFLHVELAVIKTNLNALKFYEKNNFTIVYERMDSINNIELVIMKKQL